MNAPHTIEIKSASELRTWLEQNHRQQTSVWLITYKKIVPDYYVSTNEVLDELICFGWIDGARKKCDEQRTMQLISPRRVSHWSATYKLRYARLVAEGRVQATAIQMAEEAQRSGAWLTTQDADDLVIPPELVTLLREQGDAWSFFQELPPSAQRFTLRWILLAKRDETKMKRMEQVAKLAARQEKIAGL